MIQDIEKRRIFTNHFNSTIEMLEENGLIRSKDISDGYHTFEELYQFRKMYNAALFNQWAAYGYYNVHKSFKHHDGEFCFGKEGEWFIVVALLPQGQISNHYKKEDWDLFRVPEVEKALYEFDGHTPKDVLNRIEEWIKSKLFQGIH